MPLDEIEEVCCVGNDHQAKTKLICLESTHNYSGGKALSLEYISKVREIANRKGIKMHIDGARIFNAAVKLGVSVAEYTKDFDSVQFCLSKGLGAPIGTVIVGSKDFINQARLDRKIVGGGWRQAGHLAAPAHYSLDNAYDWIEKDHERTLKLAQAVNAINNPKIFVNENGITNMVLINVPNPMKTAEDLRKYGVCVMPFDEKRIRAVLHRNVDDEALDKVIDAFKKVFSN